MQVAILAAGRGTRLGDETKDKPKVLVDICGKPFLQYQLEMLKNQGITDILLCVGYKGDMIERHFGNGRKYGVKLKYSYEREPLGTARTLANANRMLHEVFISLYGDSYVDVDFGEAGHRFFQFEPAVVMTVYRNKNKWGRSNVLLNGNRVVQYDKENPSPLMEHIEYGVNVIDRRVIPPVPHAFGLETLWAELSSQGKICAYEATKRFYEIGSPEGLAEFRQFVANGGIR